MAEKEHHYVSSTSGEDRLAEIHMPGQRRVGAIMLRILWLAMVVSAIINVVAAAAVGGAVGRVPGNSGRYNTVEEAKDRFSVDTGTLTITNYARSPASGTEPPPDCSPNHGQPFQFVLELIATSETWPIGTSDITLTNGVLTDFSGRTAEISPQGLFEFEYPEFVTGHVAVFSVCGNGTLAHTDSVIFWACPVADIYDVFVYRLNHDCHEAYVTVGPMMMGG